MECMKIFQLRITLAFYFLTVYAARVPDAAVQNLNKNLKFWFCYVHM
jgi:hypothetical protein